MNLETYFKLIDDLILKIRDSQFKPDCVVGVVRGGYIPSEAISRAFKVPLVLVRASSYSDKSKIGSPVISEFIGKPFGKVLIVDDLVDSGETLLQVKEILKDFNPKTAVIWTKKDNIADFFVKRVEPETWIEQPMEMFDLV
jgi:hypothetical protein